MRADILQQEPVKHPSPRSGMPRNPRLGNDLSGGRPPTLWRDNLQSRWLYGPYKYKFGGEKRSPMYFSTLGSRPRRLHDETFVGNGGSRDRK